MDVRPATQEDMPAVWRLTHDVYQASGYCEANPHSMLRHYPLLDGIEETTVYIAEDAGEIVGTNSLTVDGPWGLHTDEDFPRETRAIRLMCRHMGWRLGCSWRICTTPANRNRTATVKSLFRATIEGVLDASLDALLFEFHPRHAKIYKRTLGLDVLAEGTCGSVDAPSVLMCGIRSRCEEKWRRYL